MGKQRELGRSLLGERLCQAPPVQKGWGQGRQVVVEKTGLRTRCSRRFSKAKSAFQGGLHRHGCSGEAVSCKNLQKARQGGDEEVCILASQIGKI